MIRFEQVGKRYPNGHVGLHEVSFLTLIHK